MELLIEWSTKDMMHWTFHDLLQYPCRRTDLLQTCQWWPVAVSLQRSVSRSRASKSPQVQCRRESSSRISRRNIDHWWQQQFWTESPVNWRELSVKASKITEGPNTERLLMCNGDRRDDCVLWSFLVRKNWCKEIQGNCLHSPLLWYEWPVLMKTLSPCSWRVWRTQTRPPQSPSTTWQCTDQRWDLEAGDQRVGGGGHASSVVVRPEEILFWW